VAISVAEHLLRVTTQMWLQRNGSGLRGGKPFGPMLLRTKNKTF